MSELAGSQKARMIGTTTARNRAKPGHLFLLATVLLGLCCGTLGCRHSGPPRYHLAGRVTFRGNPVPVGRVQFLPDTSRGNHGPAGFAAIENGVYDTRRQGRGSVGGPHVVVIAGYDGKPMPSEEALPGTLLFSDYRLTMELPCHGSSRDFEIPPAQ